MITRFENLKIYKSENDTRRHSLIFKLAFSKECPANFNQVNSQIFKSSHFQI